MASNRQWIELEVDDLRPLLRNLRQEADGSDLRTDLRREFKGLSEFLLHRLQARIAAIPSKQVRRRRKRPLRVLMQQASVAKVYFNRRNVGAVVAVAPRKMPQGMHNIPGYMDGSYPRWRHPVFGNREVWVSQPHHAFFRDATTGMEPLAVRAAEHAVERMQHRLERRR